MPNRLANESSPYLLQHAGNPVDWYPWCDEALARARDEQKPIFLSIGYSACHWCHVMEHESFEDKQIANFLNEHFVCIKVDREERPDLDQIYMSAVQIMNQGQGGWPMSVFLTSDQKPFFGGTYWPPYSNGRMPGFDQITQAISETWENRRQQAVEQADNLTQHIHQIFASDDQVQTLANDEVFRTAAARLESIFDFTHGGFGGAPKFPHAIDLQLLLRIWHRTRNDGLLRMVRLNLDKMAAGGIYDHLGGGFSRYSVDQQWLVPHFEKMLYDNALLTSAYLDAYQATGQSHYATIARQTLDYVLKYMTDPQGGFHSTEDADSEGEEGIFYVWRPDQIQDILGNQRAERFCYVYDVTENGNFESKSILNLPKTLEQCAQIKNWDLNELLVELAEDREKLLKARDQRIRPSKDDKVLVSWNGLMIDTMAKAAGILSEPRYLEAAERAADFLLTNLRDKDGRLLHSWRNGTAKLAAYLDDYACLANALVTLYEVSFQERWISQSAKLIDVVLEHFRDPDLGGFYFTADDHEPLITRTKDFHDSSVPSASGMVATVLIRMGKLCGKANYLDAAHQTLASSRVIIQKSPTAAGQLLLALDLACGPTPELAIVGPANPELEEIVRGFHKQFIPRRVLAWRDEQNGPDQNVLLDGLFAGKSSSSTSVSLYQCDDFQCAAPLTTKESIVDLWRQLGTAANHRTGE